MSERPFPGCPDPVVLPDAAMLCCATSRYEPLRAATGRTTFEPQATPAARPPLADAVVAPLFADEEGNASDDTSGRAARPRRHPELERLARYRRVCCLSEALAVPAAPDRRRGQRLQ